MALDISQALSDLREQLANVEQAIAALEKMSGAKVKDKRGRKSMGPEERARVSARIKKYWSKWREEKSGHQGSGS